MWKRRREIGLSFTGSSHMPGCSQKIILIFNRAHAILSYIIGERDNQIVKVF